MDPFDVVFFAMWALTSIGVCILWSRFDNPMWDTDDMDEFAWWAFSWTMRILMSFAIGAMWMIAVPIALFVGLLWLGWRVKNRKKDSKYDTW